MAMRGNGDLALNESTSITARILLAVTLVQGAKPLYRYNLQL
jgi:hypothetical protein